MDLDKIKDFVLRNLVWLILIGAGLAFLFVFFGEFFFQFIGTLLMCIIAEGVALGLSGIALYAFTTVKFTRLLTYGDDHKLSATERHGLMQVTGYIFLGTHFVVGIVVAGLYFATFV